MQIVTKEMFQEVLETLMEESSEIVEISPGFGVKVVALTAEGAMDIIEKTQDETEKAMYVWVSACVVDENLSPMFSVDEVKKLPNKVFGDLSQAVIRLNGLLSESSVEDAEKNSEEVES